MLKRLPLLPNLAPILVAAPALAAEPGVPSSLPERIAFGLFLVGTIVFFAWVAWLARRP